MSQLDYARESITGNNLQKGINESEKLFRTKIKVN